MSQVTSEATIDMLIKNSVILDTFIRELTTVCVGWIVTLGPYPEREPDRVVITVGYLSGPLVFSAEGVNPDDAFGNLQDDSKNETFRRDKD